MCIVLEIRVHKSQLLCMNGTPYLLFESDRHPTKYHFLWDEDKFKNNLSYTWEMLPVNFVCYVLFYFCLAIFNRLVWISPTWRCVKCMLSIPMGYAQVFWIFSISYNTFSMFMCLSLEFFYDVLGIKVYMCISLLLKINVLENIVLGGFTKSIMMVTAWDWRCPPI